MHENTQRKDVSENDTVPELARHEDWYTSEWDGRDGSYHRKKKGRNQRGRSIGNMAKSPPLEMAYRFSEWATFGCFLL